MVSLGISPRYSGAQQSALTLTEAMKWYVYIAQCGDNSLYTGITTDPEQRLQRHNSGRGSKYVRSKGTARLVYVEPHQIKSSARARELEIKSWGRKKKLALVEYGSSDSSRRRSP